MLQSIAGTSVVRARFNREEDPGELNNKRNQEDQNTELAGGRAITRCAGNSRLPSLG